MTQWQPKILHAFIILTKVILGICWAILESDTWEPLVELTRNDPIYRQTNVKYTYGPFSQKGTNNGKDILKN